MNNSEPVITAGHTVTASSDAPPATPEQTGTSTADIATPAKLWFYETGGQRMGAVTEQDMIGLIRAGTLTHGSAVWKKGFPDWLNIENTELRTHLDDLAPPPLTGQHVNNSVVWVLAFAPVLGFFLEYFIAGVMTGSVEGADNAMDYGKYWYITLMLNLALSYWDEKRLKKAGINTERFSGWVWLVPVYLYQRATALQQNLAYFIVWLVCFALVLFG